MFVEHLNNLAESKSIVMFGVINTDLVPFADKLEGSTQGVIEVSSIKSFVKRDRATGRITESYSVSEKAYQAALDIMGYPVSLEGGQYQDDIITG
jgi:hypothetical protein